MKQVLIVDASPMFREFLKEKLSAEKVNVEVAQGKRDAFTKMITSLPDLIILDISESFVNLMDFFQKKAVDPNAKHIPMIISGPLLERSKIADLAQFGVVKYFTKPIKFDIFFESIGRILQASFSIDVTPCILEIHHNNNIVFVEIAQGINREKIALLKYKLSEMIDTYNIQNPKIILMMTNLELSFVDAVNLELLLDNVIADERILRKNVKILSLDSFAKELIDGHPQYNGIEVVQNLANVLNKLIDNNSVTASAEDVISDSILTSKEAENTGSVEMRFYSDSGTIDEADSEGNTLLIAVVDEDSVTRTLLENTFKAMGAKTNLYDSGTEFLKDVSTKTFDLVILDIYMPGLSGFDILSRIKTIKNFPPVIIYTQAQQREVFIQAIKLGAKDFMVKPSKPELIRQKVIEVLHGKI